MTTAVQLPASLLTAMLAGQLIEAFSLSVTVTVTLQSAALPAASVTRKVCVVTPSAPADPEARAACCGRLAPAHSSVPGGAG